MNNRIANALVSSDHAEARGDLARRSAVQLSDVDHARLRLAEGDETADHALALILDRQVRMPAYRWEDAQRSFAKLAAKAKKRGLPVPLIEEVSREVVGEGEAAEEWLIARILGAAPVLNGWRCVATLTQVTSDELIRQAIHNGQSVCAGGLLTLVGQVVASNGDAWTFEHVASGTRLNVTTDELVTHNRAAFAPRILTHITPNEHIDTDAFSDMRCDHCGHSRRRNCVFVLRHKDGRELCVGSTCLNEYLGTDALGAWFMWSRLWEQVDRFSSPWGSLWNAHAHAAWLAKNATAACRRDTSREVPVPLRDFVAACMAHIAVYGYVTRSKAYDTGDIPTGQRVWTAYQTAEHVAPSPEHFDRADGILAWIDALDRDDIDGYGDFRYTASLARYADSCKSDGVSRAEANMLASAVGAYDRELSRRAADAQWTDGYAGTEGEKVVLDLVARRSIGWALACADAEGHQVLLRTHAYKDKTPISIGDTLRVSGTIGRLSEYRGVKQTFVTRPSVYRPGQEPKSVRKRAAEMTQRRGESTAGRN